jgi:hypothetical protein
MSSPPPPFSFLSFFPVPFFCLTAPQAFSRPDRALSQAGARRCCQGWPLFSGHPSGAPAFTAIEHDGRLDGSGSMTLLSVIYPLCQHALFRSRMLLSAGLATKSMARAIIASTYIRQLRSGLPRCCLHGRSRRRDGTHLWDGRSASADLRFGSTATHPTRPTHPRLGCRNSAQCRRYRVRVAPCGTRPCSR